MAVLTSEDRKHMPASEFAVPGRRFPIPDKAHARNALARLNQAKGLTHEEKMKVIRMAHAKLGGREERGEHERHEEKE